MNSPSRLDRYISILFLNAVRKAKTRQLIHINWYFMLMYSHSLLRRWLFVVLHVASVILVSGCYSRRHVILWSPADFLLSTCLMWRQITPKGTWFFWFYQPLMQCVHSIISEIIWRLQDVCKRYGILFNTSASVFGIWYWICVFCH